MSICILETNKKYHNVELTILRPWNEVQWTETTALIGFSLSTYKFIFIHSYCGMSTKSQNNLFREAVSIARLQHGKHATALLSEHSLTAQRLVAIIMQSPQQTCKQQQKSCSKQCFSVWFTAGNVSTLQHNSCKKWCFLWGPPQGYIWRTKTICMEHKLMYHTAADEIIQYACVCSSLWTMLIIMCFK
jgi:hypothetical protein